MPSPEIVNAINKCLEGTSSSVGRYHLTFKYSNKKLTLEDIDYLIVNLSAHASKIVWLELENVMISPVEFEKLCQFIELFSNLYGLDLENCNIGPSEANTLSRTFSKLPDLKDLNLRKNKIGDEGIACIVEALQHSIPSLYYLKISNNNIHVAGAMKLAEYLKTAFSLVYLEIGSAYWGRDPESNQIGDEGVIAIVDSLQSQKNLGRLYLAGQNITERGMNVLAKFLQEFSFLRILDLRDNIAGKDIENLFRNALEKNYGLIGLQIDDRYNVFKEVIDLNQDLPHILQGIRENRFGNYVVVKTNLNNSVEIEKKLREAVRESYITYGCVCTIYLEIESGAWQSFNTFEIGEEIFKEKLDLIQSNKISGQFIFTGLRDKDLENLEIAMAACYEKYNTCDIKMLLINNDANLGAKILNKIRQAHFNKLLVEIRSNRVEGEIVLNDLTPEQIDSLKEAIIYLKGHVENKKFNGGIKITKFVINGDNQTGLLRRSILIANVKKGVNVIKANSFSFSSEIDFLLNLQMRMREKFGVLHSQRHFAPFEVKIAMELKDISKFSSNQLSDIDISKIAKKLSMIEDKYNNIKNLLEAACQDKNYKHHDFFRQIKDSLSGLEISRQNALVTDSVFSL
jgi:hypothetical protein